MAWRRPGNKPLSEPMMISLLQIYASLCLNELIPVYADMNSLVKKWLVVEIYVAVCLVLEWVTCCQ